MTDAFGVVALVALVPLIAVQVMGIQYKRRMTAAEGIAEQVVIVDESDEILEFEEEDADES